MDRELANLKDEIVYLKKRIAVLERAENHRKVNKYLKLIIKIVVLCLFIFAVWRGYDYFVNGIPKIIEEKIQNVNPFKKK